MAGEKEGKLVKLDYDFNTVKCCEVEYKPGKWARATVREFRSFRGNRRILNVDDSKNPSQASPTLQLRPQLR